MADNIDITPGTGRTVSTEEITTLNGGAVSAQHAQRVIPALRTADGTAVDLTGETHLGEVGTASDLIDVTLTLDTAAYASGDLLADTQAITNAVRIQGGRAVLHSLLLIDEDDQGVAMIVYILGANNTFGTENSAPSVSDASARDIQAVVDVAATDWRDLGGVRVANLRGIGALCEAAGGSRDLYVAVVNSTSAPTFTASGLRLRFGFLQD